MPIDLDAAIRERLDDPKSFLENGIEPLIRAILTVLDVHRPVHTKGSGVNTAAWDDCASCRDTGWGGPDVAWPCESVLAFARALGIAVDDA